MEDTFSRLASIYRDFSKARHVASDSQMCSFWKDHTVEVLEGSDE
jgi:hypothetical protein